MRPRVLFVGRTRYHLPLDRSLARKFEALSAVVDVRVFGSAPAGAPTRDATFVLARPFPIRAIDGLLFHLLLPFRVARQLREFGPRVVIVQGAHEAAAVLLARKLARVPTLVVLDVHGDWRTATRLYGAPTRRLLNPIADRVAAWSVRHVDAVRTVSDFTTALVRELGVEPAATFPAFMDLQPFLREREPLPLSPRALFVGALELYKGLDLIAAAWPRVARELPDASLRLVGSGAREELAQAIVAAGPNASWEPRLAPEEIAAELDAATCLVLPSRREGMGRVVVEAFCRGRAVVGTRGGGIEDIVADGATGVLVEPDDAEALGDALVRVLRDRDRADRLGFAALEASEEWYATPEEYAQRLEALITAIGGDRGSASCS